jgi:hypothetical protein
MSLTGGSVKLENMKLRPDIFANLPFPFEVINGQVGTINLTIPIWDNFVSPLVIEVKDVFGLVRPKHMENWKEENVQQALRASTQDYLRQHFEYKQEQMDLAKTKQPGYAD